MNPLSIDELKDLAIKVKENKATDSEKALYVKTMNGLLEEFTEALRLSDNPNN